MSSGRGQRSRGETGQSWLRGEGVVSSWRLDVERRAVAARCRITDPPAVLRARRGTQGDAEAPGRMRRAPVGTASVQT